MRIGSKILVTGATGFVGSAVVPGFEAAGLVVQRASRANAPALESPDACWRSLLDGIEVVVHLAAMVHVMHATEELSAQFHRVNAEGTARLAQQAADSGVRRFVYLSSIKVHGESGHISEASPRQPDDPYGRSKKAAEDLLWEIGASTRLEVVIVRPPLVYGPGVRANFAALAGAVRRGLPLPLGAIANQRSLVGLDNLVAFLRECVQSPAAAGQAFLVSDGDDLSTPELVRRIGKAMGKTPFLVPVPPALMRFGATLLGRRSAVDRLTGSLALDISKARTVLGWRPPFTVDEQLLRAVQK